VLDSGIAENQFGTWALRQPRPCETCGKQFLPWKRDGRFCSRVCSNRRSLHT
jgi:hypothetical protein